MSESKNTFKSKETKEELLYKLKQSIKKYDIHQTRCDFCDNIWVECSKCILPEYNGGCKQHTYLCQHHMKHHFCVDCLKCRKKKKAA